MASELLHKAIQVIKQCVDRSSGEMFITDLNGNMLYVNGALQKKTGYQAPQIIGTKAGALWGGRMSKEFYADLWSTVKYKKQRWSGHITNDYKNRTEDERMYIAPVIDQHKGDISYFIQIQHQGDIQKYNELDYEFVEAGQSKKIDACSVLQQYIGWLDARHADDKKIAEAIKYATHEFQYLEDALYEIFVKTSDTLLSERKADHQLIIEAQNNPAAFKELYKKYESIIRYYFTKRLGHTAQAYDLTQDTFLKAFMYLDRYKIANASYKTYLLRIAHNVLVNFFRKESRLVAQLTQDQIEDQQANTDTTFLDNSLLWKSIQQLPEIQRTVLQMKYKDELSVREIATILGKSENAIKLHLSRSRKALRLVMQH